MKSFRQYITEVRRKIDVVSGLADDTPPTPFFTRVQQHASGAPPVPDVLQKALVYYGSHGHDFMNDILRGTPPKPQDKYEELKLAKAHEAIGHMKTLFDHHAVRSDRPMTVYRFMPEEHIRSGPHAGFMSTSVNPRWAFLNAFGKHYSKKFPHAIQPVGMLQLHVPAGTPHVVMNNPDFSQESEILFNHGTHIHLPDPPNPTTVKVARSSRHKDEVGHDWVRMFRGHIVHPGS